MTDVFTCWVRCKKNPATGQFEVTFRDSPNANSNAIDVPQIARETKLVFIPDHANSALELNGFSLKIAPVPPSKDINPGAPTTTAPSNALTVINKCTERAEINLHVTVFNPPPGNGIDSGRPTIRNRPPRPPLQVDKMLRIGLALLALVFAIWFVGHVVLKAF